MVEPRACVVEVTRIVPAEDVPYVAARVAERLGMPLERVRKLIDDRTGPITKPLRPDKADAIAQTFEAAGVEVLVRAATAEDDAQPSSRPPAAGSSAATEQPGSSSGAVTAPPAAARPPPEASATADEPSRAGERADRATAPPVDTDTDADTDDDAVRAVAVTSETSDSPTRQPDGPAVDDEPERAEPDAAEVADREPEDREPGPEVPTDEPEIDEPVGDEPEIDEPVTDEPEIDEPVTDEPVGHEPEIDEPVGDEPEIDEPAGDESEADDFEVDEFEVDEYEVDEPELGAHGEPGFDEAVAPAGHEEGPPRADAGSRVDRMADGMVIDVNDDHGPLVDEHASLVPDAAGVGQPPRIALEPDGEDDDTNDPGPFGLAARGEVALESGGGSAQPGDPARPEPAAGREQSAPRRGSAQDDASAEPSTDERLEGEGLDPEVPSTRLPGASPFGDPSTWHGGDDPSGGWRIGPRAGRRLEVVNEETTFADLADDSRADATSSAATTPTDEEEGTGLPEPDAAEPHEADAADLRQAPGVRKGVFPPRPSGHVPPPGVPERRTGPRAGRTPQVPRPPLRPPPAPDPAADAADTATERAEHDQPLSPVPTAWRGLGGGERGPARPVDARLPRRGEVDEPEARRAPAVGLMRRRVLLLVALAVALALFVLAQAWVAGRAAPAFDAGLHRFRDADFMAAQRVWTQLASAGDANAQFMLGYLSEAGLGRPWSARAAASWYRLAADAGHAEAQWRLANLYERGLGVPHDPTAAARWWSAAAAGGHAEAAFMLGRAHLEGVYELPDPSAALASFERAVALGWPAAAPYRDILVVISGLPHPGDIP